VHSVHSGAASCDCEPVNNSEYMSIVSDLCRLAKARPEEFDRMYHFAPVSDNVFPI
jgi:hypothetical protein